MNGVAVCNQLKRELLLADDTAAANAAAGADVAGDSGDEQMN